LFTQAVAEAPVLLGEFVMQPRELAQLRDRRIFRAQASERAPIGPHRIGEHEGVAPIVFRAGDGVAVPEAIELFRVQGEDVEAPSEQRIDDRAPGHLKRHRDPWRLGAEAREVCHQFGQSRARMGHAPFHAHPAGGVERAHLMRFRPPVDSDNEVVVRHQSSCALGSSPALPWCASPLYWRSRRDSPLDVPHGNLGGAHSHTGALPRRAFSALPPRQP
jgi:hypothetical protein